MSAHTIVDDLIRHMEWADARIWLAVRSSDPVLADDTIRGQLHHIHAVQRALLSVWQGQAVDFEAGARLRGAELMAWGRAYHAAGGPVIAGFSEADWERPIVVPWVDWIREAIGRAPQAPTLRETVHQVVMHSAHHRGQVSTGLRALGVTPPLVDFIAWVWLAKPAAEW